MRVTIDNALEKAKELLGIITKEGNATQLDFSDVIGKLKSIISNPSNEIKIVLLGSFSDGKTTTIAGMMEEVFDNMIIDTDESSDQLVVYHPRDLKGGFAIVDTPGLFGTKEKEVDGSNVMFSEITRQFISEAHIVLYVTSAQVPVKESHSSILKKILRELGKLDTTIFVLNKMDETGVNITDDIAYQDMCQIKKNFLIERLHKIIDLTEDEQKKINIVCVCADPKGKGVNKWLETPERYRQLSRLPLLKQKLNQIINSSNKDTLKKQANLSTVNDVVGQIAVICRDARLLERKYTQFQEDFIDSETDLENVKKDLHRSKLKMRDQVGSLHKSLMQKINSASYDEMDTLLTNDIGVQGENITFWIVEDMVNGIVDSCTLNNESALSPALLNMKQKFEQQDSIFKDVADKGLGAMKGVNNKMVLQARDVLFKSFKFKPWGATKLANGIGKAAVAIQGIMMAVDLYGKYKRDKQLNNTKNDLKNSLNEFFSKIAELMKDDNTYYKNFAPSFIDMSEEIISRRKKCEENKSQIELINRFKEKMTSFYGVNIEDVDFVEM